MSWRPVSTLVENPSAISAAGATVLAGLPYLKSFTATAVHPFLLSSLNAAAFALNVYTVSLPGRLDGTQDKSMRQGDLNPTANKRSLLENSIQSNKNKYNRASQISLVTPASWAFAIWGPIYLGETVFCVAQALRSTKWLNLLRELTAPFVAANLFQSLWSGAFRPQSFNGTWSTLISPLLLTLTAYSLSLLATTENLMFTWPLTLHFGWVTAAALVNLNTSLIAMIDDDNRASKMATIFGPISAVIATAIGVTWTWTRRMPLYGATLAWALAACSFGLENKQHIVARVQSILCGVGAGLCSVASIATFFRK